MAPSKKKNQHKKKQLSTDAFLAEGLDTDSEDDQMEPSSDQSSAEEEVQDEGKQGQGSSASKKHKKSLEKLKESDPEFYEFLKNEDQELLDFEADDDDSDEEEESGDDESDDSDEENKGRGKVHKLPKKLEVASDEEDSESDEETEKSKPDKKEKKKGKTTLITVKIINRWSAALRESSSPAVLNECVTAFKAAVSQAGPESESEEVVVSKYKVEGSTVFNAIVRLCLTDILPMLHRFLALPKQKDPNKPVLPSSSKKWSKVRLDVKSYLLDMIKLLSDMGEPAILNVLLKHVTQLVPFYACFPKITKVLLKKLIGLWSSGEETARVLAFLAIIKLTRILQSAMLEFVIKQMYMAYVKNCKFTSPTVLPMINFMQRTLVEMYALDSHLAYQHGFIYIRQLAIHLRNAITTRKQEACQAVYNWQFIHCLHLWARLLSSSHPNEVLQPLIYPLTQTIIGTIKLIPTARYYPLRFHCIKALNVLSQSTHTYIPTLPFLLEVFEITDFNKKHKSISFKPFNFACILKMSKAQLHEKSFKDGVIDQMYELLMDSLHIHAHTVAFPEIALPTVIQLKQFLKQCKVANYTKQMKQILDKIQETSKVITQRRKTATLDISDTKAVHAWESRSKEEGTPLSKYYATWRKLRDRELQHEIAGKERISGDDNLPEIVRPRGPKKATADERKEFAELFESDSDDSDDDETRFLPKNERPRKKQKTKHSEDDESDDSADYSSFDEEELEQLNKSASEDEDDESGDEDDESGDEDDESGDEDDESGDEDDESGNEDDESGNEDDNGIDNAEEDVSEGEDKEDIVQDFRMSDFDDSD